MDSGLLQTLTAYYYIHYKYNKNQNINGGDVQRKNVVNNVEKSSLWAP